MTVEEFIKQNPGITKEVLVEELCQWRDRADKYKKLFLNEAENSARLRSQLKMCMANVDYD